MTARIRTIIRRLRREEDGSLLVTALIFVTAMGLVVGAMAELASVNMRNTAGTRDQRQIVYTANSAVNAAIEAFRQQRDPAVCDPAGPAINGIDGTDVVVTCAASSTSSSGPPGANQPPLAVIALTTDSAENGFFADSGGHLYVKGGMYSNKTVSMTGGATLTIDGPLTARTGCVATGASSINSDPAVTNCNIGTAPYADGVDPRYTPAVTVAPPAVTLPAPGPGGSCPVPGPVTMPAGTYTNGQALTDLFTACAGRVFHFPPTPPSPADPDGSVGVYYFDFTNTTGTREWTINNRDTAVVGGTFPSGVNASNVQDELVGERCDDHAALGGVQFIFGGDSRINVLAGSVDLCAQHDPTQTQQEIAVYGLDSRHPLAGASPTLRQQSGCIVTGPYTGYITGPAPTKCAMIRTDGNHTSLSIQGTVYAPLAAVDAQLTSVSAQVFGRGIIARVLRAKITSSSTCAPPTCSPFRLPEATYFPGPTDVVLVATIEGNKRLRALVEFLPLGGGAPTIKSWSTMNEL